MSNTLVSRTQSALSYESLLHSVFSVNCVNSALKSCRDSIAIPAIRSGPRSAPNHRKDSQPWAFQSPQASNGHWYYPHTQNISTTRSRSRRRIAVSPALSLPRTSLLRQFVRSTFLPLSRAGLRKHRSMRRFHGPQAYPLDREQLFSPAVPASRLRSQSSAHVRSATPPAQQPLNKIRMETLPHGRAFASCLVHPPLRLPARLADTSCLRKALVLFRAVQAALLPLTTRNIFQSRRASGNAASAKISSPRKVSGSAFHPNRKTPQLLCSSALPHLLPVPPLPFFPPSHCLLRDSLHLARASNVPRHELPSLRQHRQPTQQTKPRRHPSQSMRADADQRMQICGHPA